MPVIQQSVLFYCNKMTLESGTQLHTLVGASDQRRVIILIMERETLAAIHALRVWRLYLFNHFELVTDNQGVVYLNSKKNLTKREARWIEFLADYDVEIVHRPGKENMADPLSRITDEGNDQVTRCSESHSCLATDSNNDEDDVLSDVGVTEVSICAEPKFKGLLAEGYSKDKKMKRTIDRLKRNPKLEDPYFWNSLEERLYLRTDGRQRLCIPAGPLRLELLKLCHDIPCSGHPGRDRTYSRLARSFFWPRMSQYVKRFVKSCKKCQHSKGNRPQQAPLQCLPVPSKPWEDISMDFITGLPVTESGNNAILTFIDRLTKQLYQQRQLQMPKTQRICICGASFACTDLVGPLSRIATPVSPQRCTAVFSRNSEWT